MKKVVNLLICLSGLGQSSHTKCHFFSQRVLIVEIQYRTVSSNLSNYYGQYHFEHENEVVNLLISVSN